MSVLETEAVRIEEREREAEEEMETACETVRDERVEDLGVAVGYIGGVWAFLKRSASKGRWTTVRMLKRVQDAMLQNISQRLL